MHPHLAARLMRMVENSALIIMNLCNVWCNKLFVVRANVHVKVFSSWELHAQGPEVSFFLF